jgi:hypothetical protein
MEPPSAGIRSWGTSAGAREAYLVLSGQVSDLNSDESEAERDIVQRRQKMAKKMAREQRPARGAVSDAPVRSTYTSRVRAGEEVPVRGCTPTQARNALAASLHRGLATGEPGDKAKAWHEKLRARTFKMGEPKIFHSSSACASRPAPSAQSQRLAAAALAVPRQQRRAWGIASPGLEGTPDLEGEASAADGIPAPREILERHCARELLEARPSYSSYSRPEGEGREASEVEAEAEAEAEAEVEVEVEAEAPDVPAPPAAIAFAWDHPTQLLENIGSGQCSWGPKQQRCLEAYLRQVETGGAAAEGGSTPSVRGCSTPASPMGAAPARATPCKARSCRPASAPAHSAPSTEAERVYRAPTMPTARPSTASGAPSRRACREACREAPSRPRPPSASTTHVARRPPPPPPPVVASWVNRLAPSSAQEERRRRLLGSLQRRAEDETAVTEAWGGAAASKGTPEENFAVQASLHEAIESMTPRTVARVAPAAEAAQGHGGAVWDERAAFGAMLGSIHLSLAKGHLLDDAEMQVRSKRVVSA